MGTQGAQTSANENSVLLVDTFQPWELSAGLAAKIMCLEQKYQQLLNSLCSFSSWSELESISWKYISLCK